MAALFFAAVFGPGRAARGLNFLVLVSSFGNLVSNLIGASRIIRECGRRVLNMPMDFSLTNTKTDKVFSLTQRSGHRLNHLGHHWDPTPSNMPSHY